MTPHLIHTVEDMIVDQAPLSREAFINIIAAAMAHETHVPANAMKRHLIQILDLYDRFQHVRQK